MSHKMPQDVGVAIIPSPDIWDGWVTFLQNEVHPEVHPKDDAEGSDAVHTLYVYVDRVGRALYIGVTDHLAQRHASHAKRATWFARAGGYYWYSHICCRRCLLAMETLAIQIFNPIHNIAGKVAS